MAAWAVYLLWAGLASKYRYIFLLLLWFTASHVASLALLETIGNGTQTYFLWWASDNAIKTCLWVCVVVELFNLTMEQYRGFVSMGKLLLKVGLISTGLAVLGLWLLAPPEMVQSLVQFWRFETYTIYVALTFLCLILGFFLVYFHLIPSPRVQVIFGFVTVMMIINAVSGAYVGRSTYLMYFLNVGLHFTCFLTAMVLFAKAREAVPLRISPELSEYSEMALRHLEDINEALLRLLKER